MALHRYNVAWGWKATFGGAASTLGEKGLQNNTLIHGLLLMNTLVFLAQSRVLGLSLGRAIEINSSLLTCDRLPLSFHVHSGSQYNDFGLKFSNARLSFVENNRRVVPARVSQFRCLNLASLWERSINAVKSHHSNPHLGGPPPRLMSIYRAQIARLAR